MCGGIEYQGDKIFFPQPEARLPVWLRNGNVTWVTWDRREKEAIGSYGNPALRTILVVSIPCRCSSLKSWS
jgi:hypothetical protein